MCHMPRSVKYRRGKHLIVEGKANNHQLFSSMRLLLIKSIKGEWSDKSLNYAWKYGQFWLKQMTLIIFTFMKDNHSTNFHLEFVSHKNMVVTSFSKVTYFKKIVGNDGQLKLESIMACYIYSSIT